MTLTIHSLLIHFREQLVAAKQSRDSSRLHDLESFNRIFLEFAYSRDEVVLARILESLEDAIRDAHLGVEWKSSIPTEEEINALLLSGR